MLVLAVPFLDGVHQVGPRSRVNGHFRKRPCGRRFSKVGWVDRDDRVNDLWQKDVCQPMPNAISLTNRLTLAKCFSLLGKMSTSGARVSNRNSS